MYGPESGSLDNKEKQKYVDACPKAAISKVKLGRGTGDGGTHGLPRWACRWVTSLVDRQRTKKEAEGFFRENQIRRE